MEANEIFSNTKYKISEAQFDYHLEKDSSGELPIPA